MLKISDKWRLCFNTPSGTTVAGVYDGTVSNLIQIVVTGASQYWYSISKAI